MVLGSKKKEKKQKKQKNDSSSVKKKKSPRAISRYWTDFTKANGIGRVWSTAIAEQIILSQNQVCQADSYQKPRFLSIVVVHREARRF